MALGVLALKPVQEAPRNTQVQAARQFLAAALQGDTITAKRWLSANLQGNDAGHALLPLVEAGRRRGTKMELYRLGFLVGDDTERPFVTYAWEADSAIEWPLRASIQVVFRDTAARQVWEVYLREMK
ncbi:hypothetical protein [Hymenobacter antarcticus]